MESGIYPVGEKHLTLNKNVCNHDGDPTVFVFVFDFVFVFVIAFVFVFVPIQLTLNSLRMFATMMETPLKEAPITPATG